MSRETKLSLFPPLNEQTDLQEDTVYTVLLCIYVADPATFLASDSVLGPHLPLGTAGLFTDGDAWSYDLLFMCIIPSLILYILLYFL